MTETDVTTDDPLRARLLTRIGQPMGRGGPALAPDPVNLPMIRHWVDAFDDRNPVYLDARAAARAGFGDVVAPPAMLQTWTMARPVIEGIRERGGAAGDLDPDTPIALLADAGFRGTVATNSELEFTRYLHVGEVLRSTATLDEVSELKATALGVGYFVTWVTRYETSRGEEVGRQRFRVFKFDPTRTAGEKPPRPKAAQPAPAQEREQTSGETLPTFELDVTATVVVAGAIASRDFMPVHHDRDYARAQGAPDIFMNILTTNGYVARFVTDWAGPEAMLKRIEIRLGAPAVPGKRLRFTGRVTEVEHGPQERLVHVELRAANELGDHATGTAVVALPA